MTAGPSPPAPAAGQPRAAAALALYVLLALAAFLPQSLRPADTIGYVGDSLACVYLVGWYAHQAVADPLHPLDQNILYPTSRAGALAEHQLLPSLLVVPVVWATGNAVLAYNVAVLLGSLLAAFAARALALVLGLSAWAAFVAGALYAFHTYQVNEAPRLQILFHGFLPLALLHLLALLKTGAPRHAWWTAGLLLLQGLSCNYHLLYGCLLVALVAAVGLVLRPRVAAPRLLRLALPALAGALAFLPVAWPYVQAARAHGFDRDLPAGIDLGHYVSTPATNRAYGAIGLPVRVQQQGPHFVGFVALALALVAVAGLALREEHGVSWFAPRQWVPAAAVLALLLIALSLGRDVVVFGRELGPGPYRLLHRFVPGFAFIRIPERLALPAMLFVALLAARGVDLLRQRGHLALALLAGVLVPAEHLGAVALTERVPVGRERPQVYRFLAAQPVRALAELPVHGEALVRKETLEEYFSLVHRRPIVHGYVSYPPLITPLLRRLAARAPEATALSGLAPAGVDTLVVHAGRDPDLDARVCAAAGTGRLLRQARFAGADAHVLEGTADEVYRIASVPEVEAAPMPSGAPASRAGWRYRAKLGDPERAGDGRLDTVWRVARALRGDEFFEATFPRAVCASGVLLQLRRDSAFPTRFKVAGRRTDGEWIPLAFYDAEHERQLLERLLASPHEPALGFAFAPRARRRAAHGRAGRRRLRGLVDPRGAGDGGRARVRRRRARLDLPPLVVHAVLGSPMATAPRQLALPFEEQPLWDAPALESALARAAGRSLRLTLTENRSVLLSFRRQRALTLVRLHRMFLHAPTSVVEAVARSLRRTRRRAEADVRRFMNENLHRVRKVKRALPPLVTAGQAHDLVQVFARLNARFFGNTLRVPLTWGRGGGRARRGGLTFGSYDPVLALIRIHPVLDRRDVPDYFLESVVYHEMLHHHLGGIPDKAGRTVYHSRAFREAEARYPFHTQALAWEKENLPLLLRASQELDQKRRAHRAR